MNLGEIKRNIIRTSSSFSNECGKALVKDGSVKDLKGKKIDDVYHIYGKVLNDNKGSTYSTHIKINTKTDRIIDTTCTCERFKESRKEIRNYVCKHIVATTYSFYKAAKKSLKKKQKLEPKKIINKKDLSIDINIKCIRNDGIPKYNCEFRIGELSTHLILDLRDFIDKAFLGKEFKVNDLFIYSSKLHNIKDSDIKLFEYLKNNKEKIKSKNLVLYGKDIREFLKALDKDKKINFNYDFLNYEVSIKEENVPVALTLSLKGNEFVLTHHKKFPSLLNNNGEAMFFDRNIYLPRKKQIESYIPLYKDLLKNRELRWSKSLDNLNYILSRLKNITNDVMLDHNVKEYKKNLIDTKFYFYRKKRDIYCNIKVDYFGYVIDLVKNKNDSSFLRDKTRERIIEMGLSKYKFVKREEDFLFIGDEDDFYKLITEGFKELSSIGKVCFSNDFKGMKMFSEKGILKNFE